MLRPHRNKILTNAASTQSLYHSGKAGKKLYAMRTTPDVEVHDFWENLVNVCAFAVAGLQNLVTVL